MIIPSNLAESIFPALIIKWRALLLSPQRIGTAGNGRLEFKGRVIFFALEILYNPVGR